MARTWGAQVTLCADLTEAEERALDYSGKQPSRHKIPLGFDCPEFRGYLAQAFTTEWEKLCRKLRRLPQALWVPVGSGTFATVCRGILSPETTLKCVNVHVLDEFDPRIRRLAAHPGVELVAAPERFSAASRLTPPVPSNRYYDAKLWQFLLSRAEDGDVWWNIAGDGQRRKDCDTGDRPLPVELSDRQRPS